MGEERNTAMDFQTSHNHPWICVTRWGKRQALFIDTKTVILQQWKNFCLVSAQVVIMKLNTHNSLIKQLHCVIATKWLQGFQRRIMKKTYSNASSITFYNKKHHAIYIHMYFLPVIPSAWWLSEYYIFSRLAIAGELKYTLWL